MKKRTFVAIPVHANKEMKNKIKTFRETLRDDKIRWTDIQSLHLTISFIGETEVEHIPLIGKFLGQILHAVGKNEIVVGGPGFFGKPAAPKVLWMDIGVPDEIRTLREKLDGYLRDLGYKREQRTYRPHLTIGRVKSLKQTDKLQSFIENNKNSEKYVLPLDEIIFFESRLSAKGAIHLPLKVFKL